MPTTTAKLAIMGSDPATGECFAVFAGDLLPEDRSELIAQGALLERGPLSEVREAFGTVRTQGRVTESGPAIGKYQGHDIPEWIATADGRRHVFSHVSSLHESSAGIAPGTLVLAPGFVFLPAP